jgi:hypothetical protein
LRVQVGQHGNDQILACGYGVVLRALLSFASKSRQDVDTVMPGERRQEARALKDRLVDLGIPVTRVEEFTSEAQVHGFVIDYRHLVITLDEVKAVIEGLPRWQTFAQWAPGKLFVTFADRRIGRRI